MDSSMKRDRILSVNSTNKQFPVKDKVTQTFDELKVIFDDKDYVKNIKRWITNPVNDIMACLEENFATLVHENLEGFHSYILLVLVTDMVKRGNPSQRVIDLFELYIVDIIWNAFLYCKNSWNISNKKNMESIVKIIKQLEKGKVIKKNLSYVTKEIEKFVTETNLVMILNEEKSDLLFQCRCLLKFLFDDLSPPGSIIGTTFELLNHLIYRIDIAIKDITTFCITLVFMSGKLWWDMHGYVSVKYILRSYWRSIQHIDKYRIPDIEYNEFGKQQLIKMILTYEYQCLLAWGFDYTMLNTLEKLPRLIDDVCKRLNLKEDISSQIQSFLNRSEFGFSSYVCYDDMKLVVSAVIVMISNPSEERLTNWITSLKLEKERVIQVINDLRSESNNYKSHIIPILDTIRPRKGHVLSNSTESSPFSPIATVTPLSMGYQTGASILPLDEDAAMTNNHNNRNNMINDNGINHTKNVREASSNDNGNNNSNNDSNNNSNNNNDSDDDGNNNKDVTNRETREESSIDPLNKKLNSLNDVSMDIIENHNVPNISTIIDNSISTKSSSTVSAVMTQSLLESKSIPKNITEQIQTSSQNSNDNIHRKSSIPTAILPKFNNRIFTQSVTAAVTDTSPRDRLIKNKRDQPEPGEVIDPDGDMTSGPFRSTSVTTSVPTTATITNRNAYEREWNDVSDRLQGRLESPLKSTYQSYQRAQYQSRLSYEQSNSYSYAGSYDNSYANTNTNNSINPKRSRSDIFDRLSDVNRAVSSQSYNYNDDNDNDDGDYDNNNDNRNYPQQDDNDYYYYHRRRNDDRYGRRETIHTTSLHQTHHDPHYDLHDSYGPVSIPLENGVYSTHDKRRRYSDAPSYRFEDSYNSQSSYPPSSSSSSSSTTVALDNGYPVSKYANTGRNRSDVQGRQSDTNRSSNFQSNHYHHQQQQQQSFQRRSLTVSSDIKKTIKG